MLQVNVEWIREKEIIFQYLYFPKELIEKYTSSLWNMMVAKSSL